MGGLRLVLISCLFSDHTFEALRTSHCVCSETLRENTPFAPSFLRVRASDSNFARLCPIRTADNPDNPDTDSAHESFPVF